MHFNIHALYDENAKFERSEDNFSWLSLTLQGQIVINSDNHIDIIYNIV